MALLNKTAIYESTLTNISTTKCNITTAPLALRKFPPEIRLMILSHISNTNLMKAMRVDPELYHEAMEVFFKKFPLVVSTSNAQFRKRIPERILKNIRKIVVRYVRDVKVCFSNRN